MPKLVREPIVPLLSPVVTEDASSQIPALDLLRQIGWTYLSPDEVDRLRGGRQSEVVLVGILRDQLARMNSFEYRGSQHAFTEGAIQDAVNEITGQLDDGLVRTNEKIWHLLRLGKSIPQTVEGDRRSFTIQYVDWEHPENNVYHVTEEFEVEAAGTADTRRPDIVCFVNGIPFVVAECKPSSLPGGKVPVEEAISQQLRNQGASEIPQLFHHAQLLLALAINEARYGVTGSPLRFWFGWREKDPVDGPLAKLRDARPEPERIALREELMTCRFRRVSEGVATYEASIARGRELTEQDRLLYALCRPERLLEIVRDYTVFDGGVRKVARYQQYFAVRDIMARVRQSRPGGSRAGGVVWHTQGSGKSLTMVMLTQAILHHFSKRDPRIVLVTDRTDLDEQIYGTFRSSGVELVQADSGEDLRRLLTDRRSKIVTTLVHKFVRALKTRESLTDDPDVFVLVDEGHRTQTGSLNAAMRLALPKAAYVGFTGTPILKGDKATIERFGGIIGKPYTIAQAVDDRAVVPLVYEGRIAPRDIVERPIDTWFEKYTKGLNEGQKSELKRKFSTAEQLARAEQIIRAIAWDVGIHFSTSYQGTGLKGQLVAPSKADALLYKKFLDDFGIVSSEVMISGPDTREGFIDVGEVDDTANRPSVVQFWERTMQRFGSEDRFRKDVIGRFRSADEPEIIIVVDMLLTGFDAPRNAVLYLTRPLKEHTLLQAIARVNRVYEGKDYGLVLDYYGVLGALGDALDLYTAFDGKYDAEDLQDVLTDIRKAIADLSQRHAQVWDVFKTIPNKYDREAMERFLGNETERTRFYQALTGFARLLKLAVTSVTYYEETPPELVERYRQDLKYFTKLRASVARRYAEAVDFRQYQAPIQKLIDTYVGAGEVETIVHPVDIFDQEAFRREVEQFSSPVAKAEVITNRIRHTITERIDEDPVLYRKLSELLDETWERYRRERYEQLDLLRQVEAILERTRTRERDDSAPSMLDGLTVARTYYDIVGEEFKNSGLVVHDEATAKLAVTIDQIIDDLKIVHWEKNTDVQNRMRIRIEDELFRFAETHEIQISFDTIDRLMESCLEVARRRSGSP
jgi:type I restriction enzyme R subunit